MTQEMATFYPPSSGQVDVLSTPYMEDQKFASYSEPNVLHGNMMMYMNPSSSSGSFSEIPPGNSISTHTNNCVDMPRNEVMFIPPNGDSMCIQTINGQLNTAAPPDAIPSSVSEQQLQLTSRSQLNFVDGEQNLHGLSLSLSSNTIPAPFQHQFSNTHGFSSILNSHLPGDNSCPSLSDKVDEGPQRKDLINSGYGSYDLEGDGSNAIRFGAPNNLHCSANPKEVVSYSGVSYQQYEQAGIANAILKSTYLKAAQMLLDEVVNVKEALQQHESLKDQSNTNKVEEGSSESKEKSVPSSENNELNSTNSAPELSPTERQDMQNKLDKLLGMLEEVDRRYKQYYHQMQILVSSFDLVAGSGAAKPYTALALKTISRHFRCLRDAISTQIQATRKSLGEQDPAQGGVIPRLRFVDQQLRQQRALQQFGMMRHAWRPQRGLPENAVTVLRAWLFEHFLHPYPKDSEKIMLARQTGLTRSQVANWFINARVRLWKPMVEEMYKEEFNEADLINAKAFADHNTSRAPGEQSWASEDRREDQQESMSSMANNNNYHHSQIQELSTTRRTGPEMLIPAPLEGDEEEKQRGMMLMKLQDEHESSLDDHHHHQSHGFYQHNQNGVMVPTSAYHVPQGLTGSYGASNNQVSLALGLRQIDGDINSLSAGPATAGFRPGESSHNNEMGAGTPDYSSYLETVNQQQQQQHRFSNPHLLNDFVS